MRRRFPSPRARAARLAVIATAAASLVLPSAAPASPGLTAACPLDHYCMTTYFAESTHETVVGELWTDCSGNSGGYGNRSPYMEYQRTRC